MWVPFDDYLERFTEKMQPDQVKDGDAIWYLPDSLKPEFMVVRSDWPAVSTITLDTYTWTVYRFSPDANLLGDHRGGLIPHSAPGQDFNPDEHRVIDLLDNRSRR